MRARQWCMPATPALGVQWRRTSQVETSLSSTARPSSENSRGLRRTEAPGSSPSIPPNEAPAAAPWAITSDAPDFSLILCHLEARLGCTAAHLKHALLALLAWNMKMRSGPLHGPVGVCVGEGIVGIPGSPHPRQGLKEQEFVAGLGASMTSARPCVLQALTEPNPD